MCKLKKPTEPAICIKVYFGKTGYGNGKSFKFKEMVLKLLFILHFVTR